MNFTEFFGQINSKYTIIMVHVATRSNDRTFFSLSPCFSLLVSFLASKFYLRRRHRVVSFCREFGVDYYIVKQFFTFKNLFETCSWQERQLVCLAPNSQFTILWKIDQKLDPGMNTNQFIEVCLTLNQLLAGSPLSSSMFEI